MVDDSLETYNRIYNKIKKNREAYSRYLKDYCSLPETPYARIKRAGLSTAKFLKIESMFCEKCKRSTALDVEFNIHFTYTSPMGRNLYEKNYSLRFSDLERAVLDLKKKNDYHTSKEYQRLLMTNSLRYDIMKRDGFRCRICGASQAQGAALHVDHIVPVSKGGKTIESNLRTLCDMCNLGKSDKYDPKGLN